MLRYLDLDLLVMLQDVDPALQVDNRGTVRPYHPTLFPFDYQTEYTHKQIVKEKTVVVKSQKMGLRHVVSEAGDQVPPP